MTSTANGTTPSVQEASPEAVVYKGALSLGLREVRVDGHDQANLWRTKRQKDRRRSVRLETGCSLAVLALVAWFGALSPPSVA